MDATVCAWCGTPIPADAGAAHVIHAGDHAVTTCSVACLAELVAMVAGVRLDARAVGARG